MYQRQETMVDAKEEVAVAEELVQVDTMRIVRMNSPEWPYVLVGENSLSLLSDMSLSEDHR